MVVGTCPGCGYAPAKTRDLTRHMDLTRKNPCKDLLELSKPKPIPKPNLILFDENEPQAGPGPQTQAFRKGQKNETGHLLDLLIDDNIPETVHEQKKQNYQTFDELEKWINKPSFIDLDKEVPWPVSLPDNEEHRLVWQEGIKTAKDMFKVDGAEYVISTWFAKIRELNLVQALLQAENKTEAIQEVYVQCLLLNYSEEEISEKIKEAVSCYNAKNKGTEDWIEYVEDNIETRHYEAGMTENRAERIQKLLDDGEFVIRVKWINDDTKVEIQYGKDGELEDDKKTYGFKIKDKYEPIRESVKVANKYYQGKKNAIVTKNTNPGFWVGIDEKFLVREGGDYNGVEDINGNAVVYGLYRLRKPDVNNIMPMKDGALNCVAQRVIEHFESSKRGHGLTPIRQQKIDEWEKRMRAPGAKVKDVSELEKILKRPIKLLDITHGTIFNSTKYRTGKYEEIQMVVHNGHAFPRNHHFPKNRMVEYYENTWRSNTWDAINNALNGPQAVWLIGVGDQNVSQFVLEDGRTFRTPKKHAEILKACKHLVDDAIDWQYKENIIDKKNKEIWKESLKVVDLAEQVFGINHAGSRLANEINNWKPTPLGMNENIKASCVEHGHGGRWNAPDYKLDDIVCIDMKSCYPASMQGKGECSPYFDRFGHPTHYLVRVSVNGEMPKEDITGFCQIKSFKFRSGIHPIIPIWYGKHFACRQGEGCRKGKGWAPIVFLKYLLETGILEELTIGEAIVSLTKQSKVWLPKNRDVGCAIIGKFTQGGKIDEKRLTHRLVTDEGELDFLIEDLVQEGTFAGREKCPLGFILTYHEGHQPQYTHLRSSMLAYAHINLLEMVRRFRPEEIVRIATDSVYVAKNALYKIDNVPALFKPGTVSRFLDYDVCPHNFDIPPMCVYCDSWELAFAEDRENPTEVEDLEFIGGIKEFQKIMPSMNPAYKCKKHSPFICAICYSDWYYSFDEEEEKTEIQPGQWRDKGEKMFGPKEDLAYWPKDRHWECTKNIPDSIMPTINDPITRYRVSYLNGGGGSGKTTRAIKVFKDIHSIVFTHTNALAKDFVEKRNVRAQTWHSFFRWNGVGEWTPERMGEKKFPRVIIWDEVCTVPRHILEMFINYLLDRGCQVICCGDDSQPPPFFGEMPHNWLKQYAGYHEEVTTDFRAKCPILKEIKKKMRRQNNRIQSKLFREALPEIDKWEHLEAEWTPSDKILSAHRLTQGLAKLKCLAIHRKKYPNVPVPLIYRPKDGRKQNCLVSIPGTSEKRNLVKNDIVHVPLSAVVNIEKGIFPDWKLGYVLTIHTSQGMTLESPQRVWIIDEHLAWDNLIYLAVGRVEYLNQLIRIEAPPLPPHIVKKREEEKKNKILERDIRPRIQKKLIGYMEQDKKKDREFDLSVDNVLELKEAQKDKCALCHQEMDWLYTEKNDPDQWTVDRIDNQKGHMKGNVRLACLECNRNHRV